MHEDTTIGRTFQLTEDGDLKLDANHELCYYHGKRALEEELQVRVGTREGDDPLDASFGLDPFAVAGASPAAIKGEVRMCVENDPRVQRVTDISFEWASDRRRLGRVDIEMRLSNDQIVSVNLQVGQHEGG